MNILPSGMVYFANRHLDSKVEYFTFHLLHSTTRYYYTVENYKKYTQEDLLKATEFILNMNINNIDEFNDDLYFDINTWSIEDDGNILDEDEIEITIINNTGI